MKQFLINLLGILYIFIFFITTATAIACVSCITSNNFSNWLLLSIPLFIICLAALPTLNKYFDDNHFMKSIQTTTL